MIHEAFIYSSDEEFTAVLAPFLREAVSAEWPAVAVTTPDRIESLRNALGDAASSVTFFSAADWYARPGAAVAAWRRTLDELKLPRNGAVHAIGEVQVGDDAASHERWARYESIFNRVFADARAHVVCPYDARVIPEPVLAAVRRSHPLLMSRGGSEPSTDFFSAAELGAPVTKLSELDENGVSTVELTESSSFSIVRRRVMWPALEAGLPRSEAEDLLLALRELSGHGATVRTFGAGKEWICEVRADGEGRLFGHTGTAFTIGRLICERLELGKDGETPVIRLVFGPQRDPRQRILTAAAALFSDRGFRDTGVNEIIARAGVAKATFYAYFASKDDLLVDWIRSPGSQRFRDVWADVEDRTADPAERLVELFVALGDWMADNGFSRWPLIPALMSASEHNDDARVELLRALAQPEEVMRSAASEAGLAEPEQVARQLNVVRVGAITAAILRRSREPIDAAQGAAAAIVAATR